MADSEFELPEERLSTTAQDGSRIYLHPAEVKGLFRTLRNRAYDILLFIFVALPWIHFQGEPLILLDIRHQRFKIFALKFWGHDAPILFLVLLLFVVGIAMITAIWGRGWCGWACPQTVFVDRVYRRIEEWIEGPAEKRRKLAAAPWNDDKIIKKILKWSVFFVVSLIFTHSFLAYFVGSDHLLEMVRRSPLESPTAFLVIFITTLIVLFDFGWFREQFCVIACPYGRFQSVMMDDHSLVVAYDEKRGEPRRSKQNPTEHGDCVSCYRCVQVCPTGVDIRRGVQMECIACTACIDACDEVMDKINKPHGLIRYDRASKMKGLPVKHVRTRVILYAAVFSIALTALTYVLVTREAIRVTFVRPTTAPYQMLAATDEVLNHFKVNLRNQNWGSLKVSFGLSEAMQSQGVSLTTPVSPLEIKGGSSARADLFIRFPVSTFEKLESGLPLWVMVELDSGEQKRFNRKVFLLGPKSSSPYA